MNHQKDENVMFAPVKRISWPAIFAGVILVLAVNLLLNILGIGIGASAVTPMQENATSGIGTGALIWLVVTTLIALFIGGWAAGKLAGTPSRFDSAMHGLITWGLSSLVIVYLVASAAGGLVSGAAGMLSQSASLIGQGASYAGPQLAQLAQQTDFGGMQDSLNKLKQDAQQVLQLARTSDQDIQARARMGQMPPGSPRVSASDLNNAISRFFDLSQPSVDDGTRQKIITALTERADMPQDQAQATEQRWEQNLGEVKARYQRAKNELAQAANTAASGIAKSALSLFAVLLLGAIAAVIGGALGVSPEDAAVV